MAISEAVLVDADLETICVSSDAWNAPVIYRFNSIEYCRCWQ